MMSESDFEMAIATIRSNWPPENYTMLREALTLAIAALQEKTERDLRRDWFTVGS